MRDGDLVKAGSDLSEVVVAHLVGQGLEGAPSRVDVEVDRAAPELAGVDQPEHEVCVRDRGGDSTVAVARGSGVCPGTAGPDLRKAAIIDPADRAAAGPDGVDVDDRQSGEKPVDRGAMRVGGTAFADQGGVEARAAHVGGDDVALAQDAGEVAGGDHPADRAGVAEVNRLGHRLGRGDMATHRLHERDPPVAQPQVTGPGRELADVGLGALGDEGVEHRGVHPLVLADPRIDVTRERDEQVGVELGDDLSRAPFVRRMAERPQKAHGDGVNPLLSDQARHLPTHVVLLQRHEDLTAASDALVDLADVALAHDVRWPGLLLEVKLDLPDSPMNVDRLLEPSGCQ